MRKLNSDVGNPFRKVNWRKVYPMTVLSAAALVVLGGAAGGLIATRLTPLVGTAVAGESGDALGSVLRETSENFRAVAKRVGPAVVVIKASHGTARPEPLANRRRERPPVDPRWFGREFGLGDNPYFDLFRDFGPGAGPEAENGPPRGGGQGLGSGFVIDKKGYIVTNNHVVEGADKLTVVLPDDDETEVPAKVIGTDPKTDLAVIKIEPKTTLAIAEWADSDKIEVGDWAVAIGSPFMLSHSVTSGIISAKGRNSRHLMGGEYAYDLLQTDAAINPGNSGGPLCTLSGKVVGVNTAILSQSGGYQGIGFAIPSNLAKAIASDLILHGKVTRGWLGVAIARAEPDLLKELKLDQGVIIQQVTTDSPAGRAGINPGDVIVEVAGKRVKDPGELQRIIASQKPGDSVVLKLVSYQNRREVSVRVRLAESPAPPARKA